MHVLSADIVRSDDQLDRRSAISVPTNLGAVCTSKGMLKQ